MKVHELKNIKNLDHFKLAAGEGGLDNLIENVVIFEYESILNAPENYYKNDFIVSTLIFAKEHPELIVPTVKKLAKLGISGMAIKSVYYEALPPELTAFADELGLPVFIFNDTYIEDVIVSINDYMKSKENYSRYEKDFHEMLFGNLSQQKIGEKAALINPGHKEKLAGMYLVAKSASGHSLIADILNAISLRKNKYYIESEFRFYQFHQGLFILHNFYEAQAGEYLQKFQRLLSRLAVSRTDVSTGVSNVYESASGLDMCVKESYFACCYADFKALDYAHYSDIGIYSFILPMLADKTCRSFYENIIEKIEHYDRSNHANILTTLCEYVKMDCDIKRTAKQLYQHPNTIRYRIQKIYDLIGRGSEQELVHTLYMVALMRDIQLNFFQDNKRILFNSGC